jgi:hypothetical protein
MGSPDQILVWIGMVSAEVKHWRKIGAPVLLVNMKIISGNPRKNAGSF